MGFNLYFYVYQPHISHIEVVQLLLVPLFLCWILQRTRRNTGEGKPVESSAGKEEREQDWEEDRDLHLGSVVSVLERLQLSSPDVY